MDEKLLQKLQNDILGDSDNNVVDDTPDNDVDTFLEDLEKVGQDNSLESDTIGDVATDIGSMASIAKEASEFVEASIELLAQNYGTDVLEKLASENPNEFRELLVKGASALVADEIPVEEPVGNSVFRSYLAYKNGGK